LRIKVDGKNSSIMARKRYKQWQTWKQRDRKLGKRRYGLVISNRSIFLLDEIIKEKGKKKDKE